MENKIQMRLRPSHQNVNTILDYPYETDSNYLTQNPLMRNDYITYKEDPTKIINQYS